MIKHKFLAGMLAITMALLGGYATGESQTEDPEKKFAGKTPDATLTLDEYLIAFIGAGTYGDGTLTHQGKEYNFKLGGLGVGGVGVAHVKATGDVYELKDAADFAGNFVDARIGIAATAVGKGHLWIKNTNGVYVHLKSELEGLALTLGADAIIVKMEE